MKKYLGSLTLVLILSLSAFAQDSTKTRGLKKENVFVGGNFGLSIGRYTLINIAPQVGYRFSNKVAAGVGMNFLYASEKNDDIYGNDYSKVVQGIIGLNLFGRLYPINNIMLQVQPEVNYRFGHVKYYDYRQPDKTSLDAEIVPSLLAGGGLVMPNEHGAFIISVMYDLLQEPNSPYGNRPVLNVGYNFNL